MVLVLVIDRPHSPSPWLSANAWSSSISVFISSLRLSFPAMFIIHQDASNGYGEWGSIFGDPIIATAILDRLLHHSTTVNIRGESYRLKERRKAGLLPAPEPPPTDPAAAASNRGKRNQSL